MRSNSALKSSARAALKGNWAQAVLAVVVYALIYSVFFGPNVAKTAQATSFLSASSSYVSSSPSDAISALSGVGRWNSLFSLASIFLLVPLSLGFANAFRFLLEKGDNSLTRNMFSVAFRNYFHKVWGMFLMGLFITLWSFLFIIPGIIKSFSYAMTPYILEEHPELSAYDAIQRSRKMMKGHKFDLFYLYLTFIGWFILCIFTAGIGYLWLIPYVETTRAAFYQDLKQEFGEGFDAEINAAAGR